MIRRILTPALFVLLAACAASSDEEEIVYANPQDDPRVGEAVKSVCFTRTVSGFSVWDGGDGLILKKGSKEYLVTVFGSCLTIDRAQRLGFDQRFGKGGCLGRGDDIFISSNIFPNKSDPFDVDRCRVNAIYEWDDSVAENEEEAAE